MKDMTLIDLLQMFPDDATAMRWFENGRWPDGIRCAYCEDTSYANMKHPTMPYRCRKCRKYFSVKTNSLMHASNLGYQKWALAIFLMTTSIKGISSLRLHEYIGVTQKTAWHLAHRIREAYDIEHEKFSGECEVDEAYIGGLEKNKHASKRLRMGGGTAGKIPIVGIISRETGIVKAQVIDSTDRRTLHDYVIENTEPDAIVYSDEAPSYNGVPRKHDSVAHGRGEYVRDAVHTNNIESFWAFIKRGYKGAYHSMSQKHLQRYVNEFTGRHNDRGLRTSEKMALFPQRAQKRRLKYQELIAKRK